jgi:hypothetical protein
VQIGEDAVAMARRLGDTDALHGAVLSFTLAGLAGAQHGLGDDPRRLEVIDGLLWEAAIAGDKESEGLMTLMLVHAERNDIDIVRTLLARIAVLADELRQRRSSGSPRREPRCWRSTTVGSMTPTG